ncbi:MAG: ribosomal protein S18-alanine N-acetyltransferase [Pseudomonadota bacterium]
MSEAVTLRRLGALDLDRAAALHREAFLPLGERPWSRQDFAELLAQPGTAGLLLAAGGSDAGFALCRTVGEEAELLSIAVHSTVRRRGFGRHLLRAVVDHVREEGVRKLFLEVGADNPSAQGLYVAEGFTPVGRRRSYYRRGDGPAADAVVMRLTFR